MSEKYDSEEKYIQQLLQNAYNERVRIAEILFDLSMRRGDTIISGQLLQETLNGGGILWLDSQHRNEIIGLADYMLRSRLNDGDTEEN